MIGGPLQFSPTKHRCHASVRSRVHLIEGATNRRATQKKRAIIDEDGIYSDTDLVMAQSDSSYDTNLVASSDSGDDRFI
jgi:hypothetical protein